MSFGLIIFLIEYFRIHTVFMRSYNDRIGSWPVTDFCASQNPNFVFGPSLEFVQNDTRRVQFGHCGVLVGSADFHKKYFIINYNTKATVCWRWLPRYGYCGWTSGFYCYIIWRCAGNYEILIIA